MTRYSSWGGISVEPERITSPQSAGDMEPSDAPFLAFGNGRSYGDSGLPAGANITDMRGANRLLAFDTSAGIVRAEAGMLLSDLLNIIIPHGWFLPVTPGTRYVTLGGALANDVHGKNHHAAGTFGRFVKSFELVRSDGSRQTCSADINSGFYRATIGGMGLTGVVTWIELQLAAVASPDVVQETMRFDSLEGFFKATDDEDRNHEYSVAWIDSLARGRNLGRGGLMRGNHLDRQGKARAVKDPRIGVPFTPPVAMVNRLSLKAFNTAYYHLAMKPGTAEVGFEKFFYPLDGIANWNRLYGPAGLRQFQCVVPLQGAEDAVRTMLETSQAAGHGSFLTVLKRFGALASPGLISFPRAGVTLTLDFPYRGRKTDRLLARLDEITLAAGGAVNPYKDARMSREVFEASFPGWRAITPYMDPNAESLFSRRIGLTGVRGLEKSAA